GSVQSFHLPPLCRSSSSCLSSSLKNFRRLTETLASNALNCESPSLSSSNNTSAVRGTAVGRASVVREPAGKSINTSVELAPGGELNSRQSTLGPQCPIPSPANPTPTVPSEIVSLCVTTLLRLLCALIIWVVNRRIAPSYKPDVGSELESGTEVS